ncbi:hypothetical protein [Formosa sp. A9]|uniref:hypothetical protein n=1 Tax=Formosa sp. A9 TaxID=3442641 RepID=UPI003EBE42BF
MKKRFTPYLMPALLVVGLGFFQSCNQSSSSENTAQSSSDIQQPDGFKGKIALDIRDSQSDWSAYTPKSAPEGAPNILFVLYDDTGLGA